MLSLANICISPWDICQTKRASSHDNYRITNCGPQLCTWISCARVVNISLQWESRLRSHDRIELSNPTFSPLPHCISRTLTVSLGQTAVTQSLSIFSWSYSIGPLLDCQSNALVISLSSFSFPSLSISVSIDRVSHCHRPRSDIAACHTVTSRVSRFSRYKPQP